MTLSPGSPNSACGPLPGEGPDGAGRRVRRGHPRGEGFGGFAKQYEQIEKVSAHHGDFWEVLLYGQIGRDRAVMFDLAVNGKLKFTATSEDSRVLDALAHAQRHRGDAVEGGVGRPVAAS
ncbi:hypothetical protein [Streptomyces albipurpureus]|uniref:Uncharacterized protein n=1 Tax=Streptomyces albipurpureus TaxID=2897419 RepID=A0ABT0UL75_9ACTN|nr:hypothetical protein [Streptomyces sp. CWNU-1]MCM2388148.1 hypothetical protein [Streptomyces sp. CWNU-1]